MSKTYTSYPPATAPAARHAWDYFATKYPARKIETLAYSPKCDGYPGWVCELEKPEGWSLCWGSGSDSGWWQKSELAANIKRWAA